VANLFMLVGKVCPLARDPRPGGVQFLQLLSSERQRILQHT
jgi:hypothetical protein